MLSLSSSLISVEYWTGEGEEDDDSNQHFILVISGYQREIRNEDVFERSAPVSSLGINIVVSPQERHLILIKMGLIYRTLTDHLRENVSISQWFWINFENLIRHRRAERNK